MKIKVCGMRKPQNIADLVTLPIDYVGFIFYPRSPRYVDGEIAQTPRSVKRVGVFVNEYFDIVREKVEQFALDAVQLHGDESPEYCCRAKSQLGVEVIKAFSISTAADFAATDKYIGCCNYFLFDTKTPKRGGSGEKFDWAILDSYIGKTPFFLSGGIGPYDAQVIKNLKHPQLYAIDLNSKFEESPALKNINQLEKFIKEIKK